MDDFVRLLSFEGLRRFVAVAECGGFRQAARHLHIAQPSLSRSVQELEMRIETRLFLRGPHGAALTPAGQTLLKHAQILFADMRRAADDLASLKGEVTGEIIVGANASLTGSLLPQAIAAFSAVAPDARIYVVEAKIDHILSGIIEGQFELGLAPVPAGHERADAEFEVTPMGTFPYVVVARPDHPLVTRRPVSLSELATFTWILPEPGTYPAQRLEALFSARDLPMPRAIYRTTCPTLKKALVIETGHICAIPLLSAWSEVQSGTLDILEVEHFEVTHDFAVLSRKVELSPPATRLFVRKIEETAARLQRELRAQLLLAA
jgi:DNA-binding transcriptional LysR family regulator